MRPFLSIHTRVPAVVVFCTSMYTILAPVSPPGCFRAAPTTIGTPV